MRPRPLTRERSKTELTGQVTLTLPAPPARAVDGDPGSDTALLAFYDEAAGDWTPVPSTYDSVARTVSAIAAPVLVAAGERPI